MRFASVSRRAIHAANAAVSLGSRNVRAEVYKPATSSTLLMTTPL